MNKHLCALLILVITLPLAGCASPTPAPATAVLPTNTSTPKPTATLEPTPVVPAEIINEIDQFFVDLNASKQFNGIVLLAKDGNILLHKAYGMADYKLNKPLTIDTPMPLLTFDLEAAAILLLIHQGKLSLQDSICKYLPDCPENWNVITVNDVLYHSWGIPHGAIYANINSQVDWWDFWLSPTRYEQILEKTGGKPFVEISPPADGFWSWMNYALQDKLIEQITGTSPGDYINQNILHPLGIFNLGKNYSKENIPIGYALRSIMTNQPFPDTPLFPYFPISTTEDLYKLSQEYLDPKVLPVEVIDGLRKEYNYWDGSSIDTQDLIGFRKFHSWAPYPRVSEGSLNWWSYSMGYSGAEFISFEDKVVIIIFTNEASRDFAFHINSILEKLSAD